MQTASDRGQQNTGKTEGEGGRGGGLQGAARKTLRAANKNPLPYNLSAHACDVDGKLTSQLHGHHGDRDRERERSIEHGSRVPRQKMPLPPTPCLAPFPASAVDADCCALIAP